MRGLRAGKAMVLMSRQERTEAAGAQGGHCCSFPFHHPKHHRQDLLWDRRDQLDRQHLGLQTGPEEEAGVVTALRSALWARQSLGGHRDPKGAASYGGGGAQCCRVSVGLQPAVGRLCAAPKCPQPSFRTRSSAGWGAQEGGTLPLRPHGWVVSVIIWGCFGLGTMLNVGGDEEFGGRGGSLVKAQYKRTR